MEKIKLSRRLAAIAEMVPYGSICIDVGTDHGYIPAWLIQNGICPHVFASDINAGPLGSARRTAVLAGTVEKTEFLLCNGLSAYSENSADAVIIAGMGGETIISILQAAPWTANGVKLILQPQSKSELLRKWLTASGYVIICESLIEDGRIYQLLTASGGTCTHRYSPAEYHLGALDQISDNPLFPEYLNNEIRRAEKSIAGMTSSKENDTLRLQNEKGLLEQYLKIKEARSEHR